MSSIKTNSADSVLDEIRSTIASFESLRSSGGLQRVTSLETPAPAQANPFASLLATSASAKDAAPLPQTPAPIATAAAVMPSKLPNASFLTAQGNESSGRSDSEAGSRRAVQNQDDDYKPVRGPAKSMVTVRAVDKTAKIMIVDDEPLNVMTFRQHLKMEGYENSSPQATPEKHCICFEMNCRMSYSWTFGCRKSADSTFSE
jgi:hypothetical protein